MSQNALSRVLALWVPGLQDSRRLPGLFKPWCMVRRPRVHDRSREMAHTGPKAFWEGGTK